MGESEREWLDDLKIREVHVFTLFNKSSNETRRACDDK